MKRITDEEKKIIRHRLNEAQTKLHGDKSEEIIDVYNLALLNKWTNDFEQDTKKAL